MSLYDIYDILLYDSRGIHVYDTFYSSTFFHHLCNTEQEGYIYISHHIIVRSKFNFDFIEMYMFLHLSIAYGELHSFSNNETKPNVMHINSYFGHLKFSQ